MTDREGVKNDGVGGRQRVFHRIYRFGLSPEGIRATGGARLVDAVGNQVASAHVYYSSPLWLLASSPHQTLGSIDGVLRTLQQRLGYFQATAVEQRVAHYNKIEHPAFQMSTSVHGWAKRIADEGTADAVAMLSCCFRLALLQHEYRMAADFLDLLDVSIGRLTEVMDEPYLRSALPELIHHRVVRQDFTTPLAIHGAVRRFRTAAGWAREGAFREARSDEQWRWPPGSHGLPPLMQCDAEIAEFIANYSALYQTARQRWRDHFFKVPHDQLGLNDQGVEDHLLEVFFGGEPESRF